MAQVLVQNRVALALPVIPAAGAERGHQRQEDVAQHADDREPDLARRPLRRPASEQLRHDLRQGRTGPAAGRGRHHLPRPARLQPPRLARSRQDGRARPERHGRGHRHQPAERAGRRGADRPATGAQGPAVPADHQHAGPAHRSRAVRRHHPQGPTCRQARRAYRPAGQAGRQPGRAGTSTDGSASPATGIVRLRDVARVEQGSQQYDQSCTLDGQPSVALSIYQLPGPTP